MSNSINFICNNSEVKTQLHPATSLLDFLRKHNHLTGTKEVCREGDCGACTVLIGELKDNTVNYKTVNSCITPIGNVKGKHVVTIEGLNSDQLTPIQNNFVKEGATQCGFCTPGFIVSLTGYLINNNQFNFDDAVKAVDGNICRCTGYQSIKRAIVKLKEFDTNFSPDNIQNLIKANFLPSYFSDITERLKLLNEKDISISTGSQFYAGGCTDLFVQKENILLKSQISFLNNYNSSKVIFSENNEIIIPSSCTISDIQNSDLINNYFPGMNKYLDLFGSTQIRNSATVGGNIVNASPIGDMVILLLALNSKLFLRNESVKREIPLNKFYKGYKTLDKNDNELIEQVSIPIPHSGFNFNFEKVSRRTYLDIASVNSAIYLESKNNLIEKIIISAGGVAPVPFILSYTNEFLTGKEINTSNLNEASFMASNEVSPLSDVRGSAEYKRLLLRNLIFAHFIKLFPDIIKVEELV